MAAKLFANRSGARKDAAWPLSALLICAVAFLAACVVLPVPTPERKVLEGTPVAEEQLDFLSAGVTTKQDVVDNLGDPDLIWEDANLFGYDWVMRQGILLWAVGMGYGGAGGAEDIPKHYSLLIQFDEHDRVQRFERAIRPAMKSYGDFLKDWVRGSNGASAKDEQDRTKP